MAFGMPESVGRSLGYLGWRLSNVAPNVHRTTASVVQRRVHFQDHLRSTRRDGLSRSVLSAVAFGDLLPVFKILP